MSGPFYVRNITKFNDSSVPNEDYGKEFIVLVHEKDDWVLAEVKTGKLISIPLVNLLDNFIFIGLPRD
jgi:hypothetical protein